MATQFITGNQLNHELEQLFENAERRLVLISPYIRLHERYASVLKAKLGNDKLEISVVFGKNEEDPSRSMHKVDLAFFMQFPNIEIRYEPRLHAKYYASDDVGIITSMNLYRYSQDHNIEAGVRMEATSPEAGLANKLIGRSDMEGVAYDYFDRVIHQAEPIYKKEPEYEKVMFGLSRKYLGSKVTTDIVDAFFTRKPKEERATVAKPVVAAAPVVPPPMQAARPAGYCIRLGTPIPFDVQRPLCDAAYASWSRYKDENYSEKFCHYSGEVSNGQTSVSKPILRKHWTEAKAKYKF